MKFIHKNLQSNALSNRPFPLHRPAVLHESRNEVSFHLPGNKNIKTKKKRFPLRTCSFFSEQRYIAEVPVALLLMRKSTF